MLRVLFVCVENSCRSQMAEGFARALGGGKVAAFSAGSKPSGKVHPSAVRLMAERGIDIGAQVSKGLDQVPSGVIWDQIVTMGCGDACPSVPARTRVDWNVPDPKDLDDEGFRRVRDEIERRVREIVIDTASEPHRRG